MVLVIAGGIILAVLVLANLDKVVAGWSVVGAVLMILGGLALAGWFVVTLFTQPSEMVPILVIAAVAWVIQWDQDRKLRNSTGRLPSVDRN